MTEQQPVLPEINIARAALARVLAAETVDLDVQLVVARALSQVEDVTPPLPPLEYVAGGEEVNVPAVIDDARQHLRWAVETAPTVEQVVACAAAARTLLRLLTGSRRA